MTTVGSKSKRGKRSKHSVYLGPKKKRMVKNFNYLFVEDNLIYLSIYLNAYLICTVYSNSSFLSNLVISL